MEYVVWTFAGLLVVAVVAWLVTTKRAQSELITKLGDDDRKTAAAAESKALLPKQLQQRFAGNTKKCSEKRRPTFKS